MSRRRRGSALLLCIAILALLSLFALSFSSIMRLERSAASNFVDGQRARLLANAGASRALAELKTALSNRHTSNPKTDTWFVDDPTVPVALATPAQAAYTGSLGQSYYEGSDDYTVIVLDCQGQLNVNDAVPLMASFLDRLGTNIARVRGVPDPVHGTGAAIIAARDAIPGQRFPTKSSLERALLSILSPEEVDLLAVYLTVDSWRDPGSVVAVPPANPQDTVGRAGLAPQPRSPINVNSASVELIAACVEGLSGRAVATLPARLATAQINADTGTPWTAYMEETAYGVMNYPTFMGPIDPEDAAQVAERIVAERPFANASEFDAFVSSSATLEGWFSRTNLDVPGAVSAVLTSQDLREMLGASILAANFNPSGALRRWNPNKNLALIIDKANLFASDGTPSQSLEFCFGPRGPFEISSMGRVRLADGLVVAEAELRTILDLLHLRRVSSQQEIEAATTGGSSTLTYPDHVALGSAGSDVAGWMELKPYSRSDNAATEVGALEGGGGAPLPVVFEAGYERNQGGGRANLQATASSPTSTAAAQGGLAAAEGGTVSSGSRINPDGVLHDQRDPRMLRYRAASPDDDMSQGESDFDGNVNMLSGALEFWYKPAYDWTAGGQPFPLVCGLVFAGHVQTNIFATPNSPTTGTQMFLLRNSSGDLRALRIYYEVVGSGATEIPLVLDPVNGEMIPVEEYVRRANGDLVVAVDVSTVTTTTTITTTTVTTRSVGSNYPWPPAQIPVDPAIVFARREVAVPYSTLRFWGAHEWHHIALVWDDSDPGPNGLRIFVDGVDRGSSPYVLPNAPDEQLFCKLNQAPGSNQDCFYVGGIDRPQLSAGGAFKFEQLVRQPASGTVDDVRTFANPGNIQTIEPERFPQQGQRTLSFEVPQALGGPTRLAWIAAEGYLPQSHGTLTASLLAPTGSGSVALSAQVVDGTSTTRWSLSTTWSAIDQSFSLVQPGSQLVLLPGDQIQVNVVLRPADFGTGFNRDSPVVNEVFVAFFRRAPLIREILWR